MQWIKREEYMVSVQIQKLSIMTEMMIVFYIPYDHFLKYTMCFRI